jgi:hypothetical protein
VMVMLLPQHLESFNIGDNFKTPQNMQYKLLLILLLVGHLTFGQTNKHIIVPGTKCSLIPPSGFVAATNFSGFQSAETGASIMINELPAPYQQLVDGFTAEALKARGMTLISKQSIDLNNSKATLIKVTQTANGATYLKQILVFGDVKGTVLINGIYPEASKIVEGKILDALLSTVYNASQKDNALEAAPFTINVEGTEYKVAKFMGGSLLFSKDGRIPTNKPTLIVGSSLAKVSTPNQKQYAQERLKKLPGGESSVVKEIKATTIDGLNGYEIVAEGKGANDKPELIYQVMLFNEKGDYYIILGQAKENMESNLETYRKIAKTFKRK